MRATSPNQPVIILHASQQLLDRDAHRCGQFFKRGLARLAPRFDAGQGRLQQARALAHRLLRQPQMLRPCAGHGHVVQNVCFHHGLRHAVFEDLCLQQGPDAFKGLSRHHEELRFPVAPQDGLEANMCVHRVFSPWQY